MNYGMQIALWAEMPVFRYQIFELASGSAGAHIGNVIKF